MIHIDREIVANQVTQTTNQSSFINRCAIYLTNIIKVVLDVSITDQKSEPRIIQVKGFNGDVFWEIYDPYSGKTIYCVSEDDVRAWLDTP